jgi:hypothetical protein
MSRTVHCLNTCLRLVGAAKKLDRAAFKNLPLDINNIELHAKLPCALSCNPDSDQTRHRM